MPVLGSYGAASVRAWGRGRQKSPMKTTGGAPGTVTPNARGYALAGFNVGNFAYLDAPKTAGKWYWEYEYTTLTGAQNHFTGITDNPAQPESIGGYNTKNAGIEAITSALWRDILWTASATPGFGTPSAPGDVLGFALNMDAATKRLDVYRNGVLDGFITWTAGAPTLQPIFGFINSPGGQVVLGFTTYTPPVGYQYLY